MKQKLLIIALLALLVPGALLAQDELTLDDLVNIIKKLETRLVKIESLLADPWSPDVIYKDDGICQSPLHTPFERSAFSSGSLMLNDRIHQETADAYRADFGVSVDPNDAQLSGISFGVGSSHVYLEYDISGKTVVEKWEHCEYMGHSEWRSR